MTLRSSLPVYRTTPTTVPGTRDQVQMNMKAEKGAGSRGREEEGREGRQQVSKQAHPSSLRTLSTHCSQGTRVPGATGPKWH